MPQGRWSLDNIESVEGKPWDLREEKQEPRPVEDVPETKEPVEPQPHRTPREAQQDLVHTPETP